MKKSTIASMLLALTVGISDQLQAASGTIQYDDGVITNSFSGGAIIGNRFDTNSGVPVLLSGTVDTVQAVLVEGAAITNSSGYVLVHGPQTGGGGATALWSNAVPGLTGATATVTVFPGVPYTGSSFFVLLGDWATGYVPAFGTGTNLSQGHHGMVGYTGGIGPNITGTFDFGGTLNALVRASGNFLPVELLDFSVE